MIWHLPKPDLGGSRGGRQGPHSGFLFMLIVIVIELIALFLAGKKVENHKADEKVVI